jgi:inosine-uridine nucleoside N-ribohydrolase
MCDIFHGFIAPFYEELGVDEAIVADMSVLLHDPLAFSAIINPEFLSFEKARINLATGDDGKLYTVPHVEGEIPLEAAVDADYDGFERFLMERILAD